MSAHSPLPWRVADDLILDANDATVAGDDFGDYVLSDSDAAMIVRAVNCHDDLVQALTELIAAGQFCVDSSDEVAIMLRLGEATDAAKAALAKAKA